MPVLARRDHRTATIPRDWSDLQLLRKVLGHSEVAWTELVRRYRSLIFRCITKVASKYGPILNSADIEEIYAEVLISLLRNDKHKLRQYDPKRGTKVGSWIGMISVHATYDHLRGAGRRPMLDRIDGAPDPHEECDYTPLDSLIEKERWSHLNEILAGFSDKDRTFLQLYYGQGLEAETVASRMSISMKTVYSKKHKIRAHLRRCLQQLGGDCPIADLVAA